MNKYVLMNKRTNYISCYENMEELKYYFYYTIEIMNKHNVSFNKIKKYNFGKVIVIE